MTEPMIVDQSNSISTENTNENQSTDGTEKTKYSIQNVPRLPHELTPITQFIPLVEFGQRGPLFKGPGAKTETGRYKARPSDDEKVKSAKKYALEQSVQYVLMKQQQQQQRVQLDAIKKQQALLLMCRIYIGSINFELNDAMLKQAFQPFGPVKAVSLTFDPVTNRHKGFAFLEYEIPEAAQLAIEQMNGVILGGRNIKVGRPSNMPQAQPIIDQLTEEAKNYNRIFIASIHPDLSETDIQSVFEAFGRIKSCALARDTNTKKHKGYGFIEYETIQAAHDAIGGMNLFDLGGQYLRVGRAITPPEGLSAATLPTPIPTATALAVATITATLNAKDIETNPQSAIAASQMVNNPLPQVGHLGGTIAPTTIAAALSAAAYSGPTAVTSVISTILNPTNAITNPIPQPVSSYSFASPIISTPTNTVAPVQNTAPQPTILEEPPIPIGLKAELDSSQSPRPSISLNLPTNKSTKSVDKQKSLLSLNNVEDSTATLSQQEELIVKGREQRHLLMQKLNQRRLDSRICILRNMIAPEDIDEHLEQEITEECSKYGEVVKAVIYTEEQGEGEHLQKVVKVFIEFQTSKQAEKTVESLNGRYFSGRVVKAELYDQTAYMADDLSG